MRVVTPTADLKAALSQVGRLARDKGVLPALSSVLLDAHVDGGLTLTATDLRTRAARIITATVHGDGQVLLPARMLASFVGELTGEETTFSVAANRRTTITSGRAEIMIPGLDAAEFPAGSDFDTPSIEVTLAADVFASAVSSVAHAVLPDESRPVLAGVLLMVRNDTLTLAAADGFRLAVRHIHDLPDAPELSVIVSGKPLGALVSALSGATSVRLAVSANASALLLDSEIGSWQIALIEGQFPDFTRVIPPTTANAFEVHRESLLAAVKLVTPVAKENSQITRLALVGDTLTVLAKTPQEVAESAVTVRMVRGGDVSWLANNTYLRDALEALDTDTVTWDVNSGVNATVLHTGDRGVGAQVVMPMNPTGNPS